MINSISNTVFIGKVFHHFEELASTNLYAIDLLSKNKPSAGTVISTYNQTQGRGQIGSKWESQANKNISISIILYPSFLTAKAQFQLNQVVSLAVFDLLSNHIDSGLKIKWPNDMYVNRAKIAGILIQNSLQGNKIASSVIGIGININQMNFLKAGANPTSLALETQQEYDLDQLVINLCQYLEQRYLQLQRNTLVQLKRDYLAQFYQLEEWASYQRVNGAIFEGKIIGIDEIGRLLVQTKTQVESFALKEIKFL